MAAVAPAHRRPSRKNLTPRFQPQIVRPRDLPAVVGISTTTAWRMRQRGEFPAPVQLSPGTVGWRLADLAEWLDARDRAAVGSDE